MVDKKLKSQAEKLAKYGRYGDDRILHVSQVEIDGLASLVPGGKLPINPKTGQPEAFFFLPFLAGLGAAAAPAAAAAGAGLAAAAAPAAAAAGAGLTAAAAPALAATAAPAAAGLTAAAAPAAAGLTAAAAPAAAGLTAAAAPAASGIASLGATGASGLAGATGAAGAALPSVAPTIGSGTLFGPTLAATTIPANAAPAAASGGLGSLAASAPGAPGSLFSSTLATSPGVSSALPAMSSPAAASAAPAALPSGQTAASAAGTSAAGGFPAAPPSVSGSGIAGGLGFPAAPAAPAAGGGGGIGSLFGGGGMDMSKMLQYGAMAAMMMPQGGGGDDDDEGDGEGGKNAKNYDRGEMVGPSDGGTSGGVSKEWDYFPNSHYYAEGGIATLGGQGGEISDDKLVDMTIAAIQGQSPNADAILNMFVQEFGPEALQDLVARVQGQQAGSDGLSDSVPAVINSNGMTAPAQLSEGEYVVPADVVSGLGNGSTEAGAKQLEGMVSRTREMRGMPSKPKAIDPMQAMPQ